MKYIVSDDFYFSSSISAFAAENLVEVRVIGSGDLFFEPDVTLGSRSCVIIDLQCKVTCLRLSMHLLRYGVSVILVTYLQKGEFCYSRLGYLKVSRYINVNLLFLIINQKSRVKKLHMTKNEVFIFNALLSGMSVLDIAVVTSNSIKTIYTHKYNILRKIGNCRFTQMLM